MSFISSATTVLATDIPSDTGGPYVVAAYLVFLVLLAVYVAIMAQRLLKIGKKADELAARLDHVQNAGAGAVQGDTHGAHAHAVGGTVTSDPLAKGGDAGAVTPAQPTAGASS
ncbi:MAG: hypothetical protein AAGC46_12110 [Solirubrobacteraceae bacterium]|nr:hypothetical protein [Patulibacter sp.]